MKLVWWCVFGPVTVVDRVWRWGKKSYLRPFLPRTGMSPRGKSRRLERVLTDFGSEHSFRQCSARVREHYGFEVSPTEVRKATLHHARRAAEHLEAQYEQGYRALPRCGPQWIVAEADGTMIATVEPGLGRRPGMARPRQWKEMRLVAAQAQGRTEATYGATFGSVEQAGRRWGHSARAEGWGLESTVHIVADGATWIEHQAAEVFGKQGRLLIDFYHVSEYLAAAAPFCQPGGQAGAHRWRHTQQQRLKEGRAPRVLKALAPYREPDHVPEESAPVRQAWRYLSNRLSHLLYHHALSLKLPIGSGLIESGHRHVFHARLKIPGAAWLPSHADHIAQLRVLRANHLWSSLWNPSSAQSQIQHPDMVLLH